MILTDTDIKRYHKEGLIEITPWDDKRLGTNSYDLSLGNTLGVYKFNTDEYYLDVKKKHEVNLFSIPEEGFVLVPNMLYLGHTIERTVTKTVVPLLEGKSSLARLGLSIHVTGGFGDIGFKGHWTLEMTVVHLLKIYPGMLIAQIYYIMPLSNPARLYGLKEDAKYADQPNIPVSSKMYENFK